MVDILGNRRAGKTVEREEDGSRRDLGAGQWEGGGRMEEDQRLPVPGSDADSG